MRNLMLGLAVVAMAFTGCNNAPKAKQETVEQNSTAWKTTAKCVDELLKNAESTVGKDVVVKGVVDHVCKHSGKRVIIYDVANDVSIRVESGGKIQGFNKELSGMEIAIKGVLQEKQLTAEYIDNWEEKVKAEHNHEDLEEGGEHCAAEMTSINKMRKWMKDNNKNYYASYFVNGTDYEVLD